ncbi:MAG: histidine phosphatase family protein [Clostridia bacterium]|nr:histidine phosphatase family protein [Clostridia bacterium]
MTRIYVVRHCEAQGNSKRIFQGSTDCDITEMGAKQLELLEKRFSSVRLDKIYSSPLIRAYKTALAIRGGRDITIVTLGEFTEVHGGIIEGRPFSEAFSSVPGLAEIWNCHPEDFAPEGGEPMRRAYERIWNAVLDTAKANEGKTVAVATHGGVIRCLNCRLVYGAIERLKDTGWCENTGVTLIEFDGNFRANVIFMNDTSHLPEELLPKRNRMAEVKAQC